MWRSLAGGACGSDLRCRAVPRSRDDMTGALARSRCGCCPQRQPQAVHCWSSSSDTTTQYYGTDSQGCSPGLRSGRRTKQNSCENCDWGALTGQLAGLAQRHEGHAQPQRQRRPKDEPPRLEAYIRGQGMHSLDCQGGRSLHAGQWRVEHAGGGMDASLSCGAAICVAEPRPQIADCRTCNSGTLLDALSTKLSAA